MPKGEANKIYLIFTRELGLIYSTAQGVRHLKSKLRFHLQDFYYGDFSFVRGREFWKITSARDGQAFGEIFKDKEKHHVYVKILSLIKRLLNGEEKNDILFDILVNSFSFLNDFTKDDNSKYLGAIERIIILRILNDLGYIKKNKNNESFIDKTMLWNNDLLALMQDKKKEITLEINNSLKESQL